MKSKSKNMDKNTRKIKDHIYSLTHITTSQDLEWWWDDHITEVVRLCKLFGKRFNADMSILIAAAWLHDIGKLKGLENHAETGAGLAGEYLKSIGYESEKIPHICLCISQHSASSKNPPSTIEAKVLASSDAASHFTTLFMERYFYDLAKGNFPDRDLSWAAAVKSNAEKAKDDLGKITIPEILKYTMRHIRAFEKRYRVMLLE
jgi:HD superfamily phosphodiesterase